MSTEADILRTVRNRPDDDTPRLAYADFLEDHAGETADPDGARARAEFIRVQCEVGRRLVTALPDGRAGIIGADAEVFALCKRERALLAELRDHLRAGLPASEPRWSFYLTRQGAEFDDGWTFGMSRGFADRLAVPAADWLAHGDDILAAHPVRTVRLTTRPVVELKQGPRCEGGREEIEYHLGEGRRGVVKAFRKANATGSRFLTELPTHDGYSSIISDLLGQEWPGVTFELPPRPEYRQLVQLADGRQGYVGVAAADGTAAFEAIG